MTPQQPPYDNGGCWTPEEMAERARQAFAPPVRSRDVDAAPQLRNDSERWTDWGYQ